MNRLLQYFSPATTLSTDSSPESLQRAFPSPPAPLPKRENWAQRPIERQTECLFLNKLPPEIRNGVYEYVDWGEELAKPEAPKSFDDIFGSAVREENEYDDDEGDGTRTSKEHNAEYTNLKDSSNPSSPSSRDHMTKTLEKLRQTPQPFSLLFTCRQINHEATPIAYAAHTFTTSPHLNYLHVLQHYTSLLSSTQLLAISSLAYKFPQPGGVEAAIPELFLVNALVHFPNLKKVTAIMQRFAEAMMPTETVDRETWSGEGNGEGGVCHVPAWWANALERVASGYVVRWQTGEKWDLRWTQDESLETLKEPNQRDKIDAETGKSHVTTTEWIARRRRELGIPAPFIPRPGGRGRVPVVRRTCRPYRSPPRKKIRTDIEYGSKVTRRDVIVGTGAELVQEGSGRRVRVGMEFWEYVRVFRDVFAPE
ncbi:hypothetical protein DM02DRAFT_655218 [Periconia macrospinosa]|uniref:DUF7730 domain-containing protein n=1 Tax=Periconia macrospinosa TaxID=97972 RepID=A0A2V1DRC4_9PLEO|nr:hypothetical protein DM02DRAFT_655218 [Periconia macrospinosa]